MSGCQNDGPFLGTLNIRCRIMVGTQRGTIILTTSHISCSKYLGPRPLIQIEVLGLRVQGSGFGGLGLKFAI